MRVAVVQPRANIADDFFFFFFRYNPAVYALEIPPRQFT
jgi:hypothetical protein